MKFVFAVLYFILFAFDAAATSTIYQHRVGEGAERQLLVRIGGEEASSIFDFLSNVPSVAGAGNSEIRATENLKCERANAAATCLIRFDAAGVARGGTVGAFPENGAAAGTISVRQVRDHEDRPVLLLNLVGPSATALHTGFTSRSSYPAEYILSAIGSTLPKLGPGLMCARPRRQLTGFACTLYIDANGVRL